MDLKISEMTITLFDSEEIKVLTNSLCLFIIKQTENECNWLIGGESLKNITLVKNNAYIYKEVLKRNLPIISIFRKIINSFEELLGNNTYLYVSLGKEKGNKTPEKFIIYNVINKQREEAKKRLKEA